MFYLFSKDIGVQDNMVASLNSPTIPSDSHFANPKGNSRGNLPMTRLKVMEMQFGSRQAVSRAHACNHYTTTITKFLKEHVMRNPRSSYAKDSTNPSPSKDQESTNTKSFPF